MVLIAHYFLHLGVRGSSRSGSAEAATRAVRGGGIVVDAFNNFHCTAMPIPRRRQRIAWNINNAGWRRFYSVLAPSCCDSHYYHLARSSYSSGLFAYPSSRLSNNENTEQQLQQQQQIRGDPVINAPPLTNFSNRTIVDNGNNNSNQKISSRQLTSLSTKSSLPTTTTTTTTTTTSLLQRTIRSSINRKYNSNVNRSRTFSSSSSSSSSSTTWSVPDKIHIPEDQLSISFSRASGAGGQNVNKVNTKVELRFHVPTASFLPLEVQQRLLVNEANRINNEGYFSISSQEYRTQLQNRKHVMKKLEDILRECWARPKERKLREGLSKESKVNRREMKKKISAKKESRKRVDF